MKIEDIVKLVLYALFAIGYAILIIVSLVKKIKEKCAIKANSDSGDVCDNILNVVKSALNEMSQVENLYDSVFKEGIKAGAFKSRDVLDCIERVCAEQGVPFNRESWKCIIDRAVDFKNSSKNNVQSTEQNKNVVNSDEKSVTFKGVI